MGTTQDGTPSLATQSEPISTGLIYVHCVCLYTFACEVSLHPDALSPTQGGESGEACLGPRTPQTGVCQGGVVGVCTVCVRGVGCHPY